MRKEIVKKIKEYCAHELDSITRFGYDPQACVTRCYGAVMFVLTLGEEYDEELAHWWDDEMLPKFRELQARG